MGSIEDIKGRYSELGNYYTLLLNELHGNDLSRALMAAAHASLAESYALYGIRFDWGKLSTGDCLG